MTLNFGVLLWNNDYVPMNLAYVAWSNVESFQYRKLLILIFSSTML